MSYSKPSLDKASSMQLQHFTQILESTITPYQALHLILEEINQRFSCTSSLLEYYDDIRLQKFILIENDFSSFHRIILKKMKNNVHKNTIDICSFQHQKQQICLVPIPLHPKKSYILILKRDYPYGKKEKRLLAAIRTLITHPINSHILHRKTFKNIGRYPSTTLLTWPSMAQEIHKRFPKLDHHKLASTFMIIHIKELSEIALKYGAKKEEETLLYLNHFFEKIFSPTDLIGRIGQNLFSVWLHGADRFSAAEHANKITQNALLLPFLDHHLLHLKIGLVCREANSPDSAGNLLEQAMIALYTIDEEKGKKWYFAHQHP